MHCRSLALALLALATALPSPRAQVLFDQADLVTRVGLGAGGADESEIQTSLGLQSAGSSASRASGTFVADEVVVPIGETWEVSGFEFFAYETNVAAGISAVYVQVWNGEPGQPGSSVVFGNRTANRLTANTSAEIYRVSEQNPPGTATTRLIRSLRAVLPSPRTFPTGTYWIEWSLDPAGSGPPFVPPVTRVGETTTGNARWETGGAWSALTDIGTGTPQGLPFRVYGTKTQFPVLIDGRHPDTPGLATQIFGSQSMSNSYLCYYNAGQAPAVIEQVTLSGHPGFVPTGFDYPGLPLTLNPGTRVTYCWEFYRFDYSAYPPGYYDAQIVLRNGAGDPLLTYNVTAAVYESVETNSWCSAPGGAIPGASGETAGAFGPYPVEVEVPQLAPESISQIVLRIEGLTHPWPDDLDLLLQHPAHPPFLLMSDAGGSEPVTDLDLSFSLSGGGSLPPDDGPLSTVRYRAGTNFNQGADSDDFAAPAPQPSAASTNVRDVNPGGTWRLFGMDDEVGDSGSFARVCIDIETYVIPLAPGAGAWVDARVILEGAAEAGLANGALMRTDLEDHLPLAQPYGAAPWSYAGAEAIPATDANSNGRPDLLDQHAVVDWVLVSLRAVPTGPDLHRAAALLLADGTLLDPGSAEPVARTAAPAGLYYVVLSHRTHLAAMGAAPVALVRAQPGPTVDLTASATAAYGAQGLKPLAPGLFALYAGDGNGDGAVLSTDRQTIWLPQVGQTGYLTGDFSLDGSVLADDRQSLWTPNVGVQTAVPAPSSAAPVPPPSPHQAAPLARPAGASQSSRRKGE
jgi:hypothetical protein